VLPVISTSGSGTPEGERVWFRIGLKAEEEESVCNGVEGHFGGYNNCVCLCRL
jgi:hypothetical protein